MLLIVLALLVNYIRSIREKYQQFERNQEMLMDIQVNITHR